MAANLLIHRKVVGVVLFGMVAAVISPTAAGCSVVHSSVVVVVAVVVVHCNCSVV